MQNSSQSISSRSSCVPASAARFCPTGPCGTTCGSGRRRSARGRTPQGGCANGRRRKGPEDAIDHQAVVLPLAARGRWPAGGPDLFPLGVGQAVSRGGGGHVSLPIQRPKKPVPPIQQKRSDGQVRPRVPEDAEHRLQRPAVHGQRRRRRTRRRSASTAPPIRGPTSSRPRSSGSAAPTSPSALPITTNYVWQARENGGAGHRRRSAHHADGPHLRSVPAGQARPRRRPVQRHPAPDDRERLARSRLHRRTTRSASTRWPSTCKQWTPRRTAEVTGIAERVDPPGGRVVGHGEDAAS